MSRLAIECSTARGSVALAAGTGEVLWRTEFVGGRGHGGKLFLALADALRALHDPSTMDRDLAEIVVGLGPGSYSGVRQAIAAAIGLSAATGARLTGVPSPLALETDSVAFQAVGDARRGTYYYSAVKQNVCVAGPELLPDYATLLERLAARPGWPVLTVEYALGDPLLAAESSTLPLAERLLLAPASEHRPLPLEPLYLRPTSVTLPRSGVKAVEKFS